MGKPYMVEVVNCAWDSYWNHSLKGRIVAPFMYWIRRTTTKKAPYVLYVTSEFLQRRYPTKGKTIGVSDVQLQNATNEYVLEQRLEKITNKDNAEKIVIGTAGAVDVSFKGQRYVIEALAKLKARGLCNYEYQIAGGGSNKKLKKLAEKLGVSDQVVFMGSIVHSEMFSWFDGLDVYIKPSLQEGLPRALVEAMSRGLPCYGTRTGGIPELLDPECVCDRNTAIAKKLAYFLQTHNKEKALVFAKSNYEEAMQYKEVTLCQKRAAFMKDFADSVTGGKHEEVKNITI